MPDKRLVAMLAQQDSEAILAALFGQYEINCMNMHRLDADKLDGLIGQLDGARHCSALLSSPGKTGGLFSRL